MTKENTLENMDIKTKVIVGKPRFDIKQKAVIIDSTITPSNNTEIDKLGKKFFPCDWSVHISAPVDDVPVTFTERYSGIKLYLQEDESVIPMVTEQSSAGRVLKVLRESGIEWDENLQSLAKLIIGKKVKIIAEDWSVGEKKGFKNQIVDME